MIGRKWFCGLVCVAVLAMPGAALAESTDVTLYVNHAQVPGSLERGQAYISDAGRTMIPLRVVNDVMAYETQWQPDGSIHITNAVYGDGSVDVWLRVGSTAYTSNGVAGVFETAPLVKEGRTYLPARDFAELNGSIFWDADARSVWVFPEGTPAYTTLGKRLVRADGHVLREVSLPAGYEITDRGAATATIVPIATPRTIDGVSYLTVNVNSDFTGMLPLFRDDGDRLTYLTQVFGGGGFYVDGSTVYYTEAMGAGVWAPGKHPSWLYVTALSGASSRTQVYDAGFDVSHCLLSMENGVLIARADGDVAHVLDLSTLPAVANQRLDTGIGTMFR